MAIDWKTLGAERRDPANLCQEEDCDHYVKDLGFTPRHRWSLYCKDGQYWEGCESAGLPPGFPNRCLCPGCKPRSTPRTVLLTRRQAKRCRCDPERARLEAELRDEGDD